jgi:hypothetical protein
MPKGPKGEKRPADVEGESRKPLSGFGGIRDRVGAFGRLCAFRPARCARFFLAHARPFFKR